jgi:hypothetical protein
MPNTMSLISTITVGSGGSSTIDFTSIPQTYTDLILKLSIRGSNADTFSGVYIKINGLTTGYLSRYVYGSGTVAGAGTSSTTESFVGDSNGGNATANTFSNQEVYFFNYTTGNPKVHSSDSCNIQNASPQFSELISLYNSTGSALTALNIRATNGNIAQHSSASLYGIKNS